ncbi:DUF2622 domain-containing protein [Serratia sp. PAMC26656]|uniref:DUF2622 domain-containing protein n=1 Tax=Serratia sp. PAMC26656 TaxID=2775909 RepID=UPI0018F6911F|nr:DUF2622 domain-containing protein [Serratia sp. PAMC26656]MBJ7892501.1 DUF2622 domain-containing protein [Serratia sp. PAMC26656]
MLEALTQPAKEIAMAKFIVRVELRDSESADYVQLHEKMADNKFYKFSQFNCSEFFNLPSAEYMFFGEDINHVGYLAKSIAEQIKAYPKILVTEAKDLLQFGLDEF